MKERKLRRLPVLICILLLCQWQTSLAQNITVQGRVTTADRPNGVAGISVSVEGTTNGTTTNDEGRFRLTGVPGSAKLVFSSVGFKTQTIAVNGR